MTRESVIVSPYERWDRGQSKEEIARGQRPTQEISLKDTKQFQDDINRAYKAITDRGGKVVLEGLVCVAPDTTVDFNTYLTCIVPNSAQTDPKPSLLIIAELPEANN